MVEMVQKLLQHSFGFFGGLFLLTWNDSAVQEIPVQRAAGGADCGQGCMPENFPLPPWLRDSHSLQQF